MVKGDFWKWSSAVATELVSKEEDSQLVWISGALWDSMRSRRFMRISWNLLIKGTVPNMTFCIIWLCFFFLILSLLSWISSLSKLKIFLSYISHTDPLRQVIWLWFMKLFIFSLVIYLFESESIKINLNPTSSSNLWLSSMYASCLKQLLEKRETSTDPEQMWTRVNWFQLR